MFEPYGVSSIFACCCTIVTCLQCSIPITICSADCFENAHCFAYYVVLSVFHQALIRLISSFAVISPPPDTFLRRPRFNAQGGWLTYGTFYWLCCLLLCSSIPYALSSPPIFCSVVASTSMAIIHLPLILLMRAFG